MGPSAQGNKDLSEEIILERALVNLKKLDVVGITDRLDEMLIQVSALNMQST